MKNLKSILAVVVLSVLFASCKKNEVKPNALNGQVTYEVIETDSLNKNYSKHIRYGYDDKIIDVVVNGNFKIVLDIPSSENSNDTRNIFISCETEQGHLFKVKFNQYIDNSNNKHMNFDCSNGGSCANTYRELKHNTIIEVN